MDSFQAQQSNNGFTVPPITNPPQHQYFSGNDQDTSPMMDNFPISQFFGDDNDGGNMDESNDAKRRRIARVSELLRFLDCDLNNLLDRLAICAGRRR